VAEVDERERDDPGDGGVSLRAGREPQTPEQRVEDGRDRRLGHDAEADARHRDADPTAREGDLEALGHLPRPLGAGVAGELLTGELADPRHRELRRDEETVPEQEEDPADQPRRRQCGDHRSGFVSVRCYSLGFARKP
jgi:hypothetical protein